jgi:UDP-N-acetylmuramoyl-L-alanyl-D-glutamate--2,6-diaminopimelate ligase
VITIGIFGSNGKTSTVNLLSAIFNSCEIPCEIISSKKNVAYKRNISNIESYKKLKNIGINGIILIEVTEDLLKDISLGEIDFDLFIHCSISEDSYEASEEGLSKINSMIGSSKRHNIVVLNTDDSHWKDMLIDLGNTYLVTYGLGSKATVTASSIEGGRNIRFCYCLQRSLTDFNNKTVEPMEVPFEINVLGLYNVYNGLAAITAALILGISLEDIIQSFENIQIPGCGIKIIYQNSFSVVDNVCNNLLGYETGFETVQNQSYKDAYLVFDFVPGLTDDCKNKINDVITMWSQTLKIKKAYIISEGSIENAKDPNARLPMGSGNAGISEKGMGEIIRDLTDDDMLLFFCSSKMDHMRNAVREFLDRRILGEL